MDWRLSNADLHKRDIANYKADQEREQEQRLKQRDEAEAIVKSFSTLEVQALATGTEHIQRASLADTVSGHPTVTLGPTLTKQFLVQILIGYGNGV